MQKYGYHKNKNKKIARIDKNKRIALTNEQLRDFLIDYKNYIKMMERE